MFDPDHPVTGAPTTSDWPYADLTYIDPNGETVDSASYGVVNGTAGWQISSAAYDANSQNLWTLTASNRAQALAPTATTDPFVAAQAATSTQPATAVRADYLRTVNTYSTTVPSELVDTVGPVHPAIATDLSSAAVAVDARDHTITGYDEGLTQPGNGQPPYQLVTSSTTGLLSMARYGNYIAPGEVPQDDRTTTTSYAAINTGDTTGLTLRKPTKSTVAMHGQGGDLATITRYNAAGQVIETRLPAGSAGGTAQDTVTTYYTAGTTSGCVDNAQAGQLCTTAAAAAPNQGNPLPTTKTTYNLYDNPVTTTETYGSSVTRTTTVGYDPAERRTAQTTTVTGSAEDAYNTALPAVSWAYDPTTGLPTTTSTDTQGGTTALSNGYDSLVVNGLTVTTGKVISYTTSSWPDIAPTNVTVANTATTGYDIDGRQVTTTDGSGGGTNTSTYGYDTVGGEHRGLLTNETIGAGSAAFAASYDADGKLTSETYPNGMIAATTYDNTDNPATLTYTKAGASAAFMTFTARRGADGRIAAQTSPQSSQTFSYDPDGRLTQVRDTLGSAVGAQAAGCTTRLYAFTADSNRSQLTSYPADANQACSTNTAATTTTSTFDTADRITTDTAGSYAYDAMGRTTIVPAGDATGTGAYTTDTGNAAVTYYSNDMVNTETQGPATLSYRLDPTQNRISSIHDTTTATTTANHYTDGSDSPAWSDTTPDATRTVSEWTRNIEGPDGNLAATVNQAGAITLDMANLHGDIVATADNTADVTNWKYNESTEYGAPRVPATANTPYGWTGAKRRSNIDLAGLVTMGVRLYNPTTGRFLQVDPVPGGSANDYAYPTDPINGFDLTGQSWRWLRAVYNFKRRVSSHITLSTGVCLRYCWGIGYQGGHVYGTYGATGYSIGGISIGWANKTYDRRSKYSTGGGGGRIYGGYGSVGRSKTGKYNRSDWEVGFSYAPGGGWAGTSTSTKSWFTIPRWLQ